MEKLQLNLILCPGGKRICTGTLFYLGWLGNTCVFLQHLFPLKELSVQLVILSVLKDPACNLTQ